MIGGLFLFLLSMVVLGVMHSFVLYMAIFLVAFVMFGVALFFKGVFGLVRPHRIDRGILELQGFSPRFLELLPDISPPWARQMRRAASENERSNP